MRLKENAKLWRGDCLEVMRGMADNSVDAIVTDPPYGLSFMGEDWDHGVPGVPFWTEALRVLKPGGYLLAFGGTRTYHRLACAIEDAGFEIRDCLSWLYGSGFPKSLDVSKAIDKAAGAERAVVGYSQGRSSAIHGGGQSIGRPDKITAPAPATEAAKQWDGWGTALKPAWEPIIMARKPLEGTVAANVLKWGTGGINVDGCRVEGKPRTTHKGGNFSSAGNRDNTKFNFGDKHQCAEPVGRWPANLVHDGSDEVLAGFPGERDKSAARFFYCAKASKSERGEGNNHPTVKSLALMRWLVRMVTPSGGTVLDPFMGSGTTGVAAAHEGLRFIGIDLNPDYIAIAERRIASAQVPEPVQEVLF